MRPPPKIHMISSEDHDRSRLDDEEQNINPKKTTCESSPKPWPPLPWLQPTVFN
jgi:hypothetical protein